MAQESQKDPRIKGFPWLVPHLTVQDVQRAINFYEKAFGFKKGHATADSKGQVQHVEMTYEGQVIIMFSPENRRGDICRAPATTETHIPINIYVYCHDVDFLYLHAKENGATIVQEPTDMFWGDRIVQVKDPDGYRWTFARNIGQMDLSQIP